MDGQPFFLVHKEVDSGLLNVLQNEIVPVLEKDVPHQPDKDALAENPRLHCFTIVFDREGYSPNFFLAMREK